MYDRILVPTDGSDDAVAAAEHGIGLAERLGASVRALYVVDLPDFPRTVYLSAGEGELQAEYEDYGEEVTAEVCDAAEGAGLECETALKTGTPHEEIVGYAESEGVDLVVMGAGHQSALDALIGSTAERVIRQTEIPVMTVRAGAGSAGRRTRTDS